MTARVLGWAFKSISSRVIVRKMVISHGRERESALQLFRNRFPDNQRDNFENIVRWQQECERECQGNGERWLDYLLVAKTAGKVCGIFYGQYGRISRLLFVSYIASDKRLAHPGDVMDAFGKYLKRLFRRELKKCTGLIFELELPDDGHGKRRGQERQLQRGDRRSGYKTHSQERHWRSGREELFRSVLRHQGIIIKRIGIKYRQPRLSLWDSKAKEEPQLLMYGRTQPPPVGSSLPKNEVVKIVNALYNEWYGDSYEDDAIRDVEYRAYLQGLYREMVAPLPNEVPTL